MTRKVSFYSGVGGHGDGGRTDDPYRNPAPMPPIYIEPPPRRPWRSLLRFPMLCMVMPTLLTLSLGIAHITAHHEPKPCVESVTILTLGQKVSCPVGATLLVKKVEPSRRDAAICVCGTHP